MKCKCLHDTHLTGDPAAEAEIRKERERGRGGEVDELKYVNINCNQIIFQFCKPFITRIVVARF